MRRYGYAGYGGYGNDYPNKEQPLPYQERPRGDLVPRLVPPDLAPRRPTQHAEIPQIEPDNPAWERFAAIIARRLEHSIIPAFDGLRFCNFQTINVVVTNGGLLLPKPTTLRTYLRITSIQGEGAGPRAIAFDRAAQPNDLYFDPDAPSPTPFLEWMYTVPQGVVYAGNPATTYTYVVTWAELDPRQANDLAVRTTEPPR